MEHIKWLSMKILSKKIEKTKQIFCIRNRFLKRLRIRVRKPKRRIRAIIVKIVKRKPKQNPEEIYIHSQI